MIRSLLAAAAALFLVGAAPAEETLLQYDDFGKLHVVQPNGTPTSMAIVISDIKGWDSMAAATAEALAKDGALVLGLDWKLYRAHIEKIQPGCLYPAADMAAMAQFAEKKLSLPKYLPPILVGLWEGGAAAYPIFAQGPRDTFKGALGVGFCPSLQGSKPMCKGHSPDLSSQPVHGGFSYAPASKGLANFVAITGMPGQTCDAASVEAFVGKEPQAKAIEYDPNKDEVGQIVAAYRDLAGASTAFAQEQQEKSVPAGHVDVSGLDDLPLTVVPSNGDPKSFVIFLTGDGGWAGIDQTISEALSAQNVEVIGLDTLSYFWQARTHEETAGDLNRIFDAIRRVAPNAKVKIVGFSFGAEVSPVVYPLLADSSKAMLSGMALLVPGTLAVFEFSSEYWLGVDPDTGDDVEAAIRADTNVPVLCIYSEDDDGACPAFAGKPAPNVTAKVLGSGHHFSGRYDELASMILAQ